MQSFGLQRFWAFTLVSVLMSGNLEIIKDNLQKLIASCVGFLFTFAGGLV